MVQSCGKSMPCSSKDCRKQHCCRHPPRSPKVRENETPIAFLSPSAWAAARPSLNARGNKEEMLSTPLSYTCVSVQHLARHRSLVTACCFNCGENAEMVECTHCTTAAAGLPFSTSLAVSTTGHYGGQRVTVLRSTGCFREGLGVS